MILIRPVQTRSRYGSATEWLSLASLKQLVGSLCKRHAVTLSLGLQPLVGARFQVLFHSPARGSSHLSLTVLVRYRSSAVFSRVARTGVSPSAPEFSKLLPVPAVGIRE